MVIDKTMSKFNAPISNTRPVAVVSLADVYEEITSDAYKAITEKLRSLDNKDEAREFKKMNFPSITPSGVFTQRGDEYIVIRNGKITMDIDDVAQDLDEVKEKLINDPVFKTDLLFVSPRGKGLKWFTSIDLKMYTHKEWYTIIANYIREKYELEADMTCSHVSRACYLCHDPKAYACSDIFNQEKMDVKLDFESIDFSKYLNMNTVTNEELPTNGPIVNKLFEHAGYKPTDESLEQEVEKVCLELELRNIDITNDYEDWRNVGFALAEGLGEHGRSYFHQVSRLCPSKYNESECDKVYTYFLKSRYSGTRIGIGTFFDYAKKAGINISAIARECKGVDTFSHYTQNAKCGEEALATFNHKRPTFSDQINSEDWPRLLHPLLAMGNSTEYTDMTFLGLFALASGIIPNVIGKYHKRTYFANFYAFVVAPPASSKGDLPLLLSFTRSVEDLIRAEYEQKLEAYRQKVAQQQAKATNEGATPSTTFMEPAYEGLYIPGDISASALYETIRDNQERGNIMFEPEADVITQACRNKEWGDFSTGLRKAFHHESIQFFRRANKERVEVQHPRLSVLISGTPKQVGDLIPNSENGLFSRWAFYAIPQSLEWQDVFAEEEEDYASIIERMGKEYYHKVYIPLSKRSEVLMFKLHPYQQEMFNDYLSEMQYEQVSLLGHDIAASVRRLGLITFRLAMVLSVLRLTETDIDITTMDTLMCDDRDFYIAMEMSDVLISHAASVFSTLLRQPRTSNIEVPDGMTYVEKKMLEQLNTRFTRQEYLEIAKKEGVNEKSASRYLGNLVNRHGIAIRVKNGVYELIE